MSRPPAPKGTSSGSQPSVAARLSDRLSWSLIPAVPVPFRGRALADDAQRAYARWMATQPVAGVAVWAHTGRGPHLSIDERTSVLETWRAALPDGVIVAGASSVEMAREARSGGADALLAFPTRNDPVAYHAALGEQLPVMAFDLYEAAGGVPYSDASLRALLELPSVTGIKVATLDSVVRFQRIAEIMRDYPDKLLVTGEDRFLGYSMMMGATAALIGMGAVLTELQARLIDAFRARDWPRAIDLTTRCDALGSVVFGAPVEGYIRRTLWALAVEGIIPESACDDPWGPPLPAEERVHVAHAVQAARLPPGVVS